jgi:DNA-binding response OmpR family regulator
MAYENQPKIIAITGHIENEYVDRALKSGMDKIFQKPLHAREFGQLLMDMRYITTVPAHLKLDEVDEC